MNLSSSFQNKNPSPTDKSNDKNKNNNININNNNNNENQYLIFKFKNWSVQFPLDKLTYERIDQSIQLTQNVKQTILSAINSNETFVLGFGYPLEPKEIEKFKEIRDGVKKTLKNRKKNKANRKNKAIEKEKLCVKNALNGDTIINKPKIKVANLIRFDNVRFTIKSKCIDQIKNTYQPEHFQLNYEPHYNLEQAQFKMKIKNEKNIKISRKEKKIIKRKCYYCKIAGHYIGQCPQKVKDENKKKKVANAKQYVEKCSVRKIINKLINYIKEQMKQEEKEEAKRNRGKITIKFEAIDKIYEGIFDTKIKFRNTTTHKICHNSLKLLNKYLNKQAKIAKKKGGIDRETVFLKLKEKVNHSHYAKDQLRQQVNKVLQKAVVVKHRVTEAAKARHQRHKLRRLAKKQEEEKQIEIKKKEIEEKYYRQSIADNLRQIVNLNQTLKNIKFEDIFDDVINGDKTFRKMKMNPFQYSELQQHQTVSQPNRAIRNSRNGRNAVEQHEH